MDDLAAAIKALLPGRTEQISKRQAISLRHCTMGLIFLGVAYACEDSVVVRISLVAVAAIAIAFSWITCANDLPKDES